MSHEVDARDAPHRSPGFWEGKRVLVTGHTGFKGGWLSLWLQSLGAHVIGYALAPGTRPSLFEAAAVGRSMISHIADVRDAQLLLDTMRAERPEIVFHLAAQPLVRRSYRAPVDTYATNVMGTIHVLDAVRQTNSVRSVVCVTSDKCYGTIPAAHPYLEDDPMGGIDPYSSSKGCCELAIASYRSSYFRPPARDARNVALASARAGNVIGGGDWSEDRLVVDVVKAFLAKRTARIRSPTAVRPWQHVLDPLHGYMSLAERLWTDGPSFAEPWNFGPEPADAQPVAWIVDALARHWGAGASWSAHPGPHPHETETLMLDASKARARLGWSPRLRIDEALAWTVDWYRSVAEGADARALTQDQISRYERMLSGATQMQGFARRVASDPP